MKKTFQDSFEKARDIIRRRGGMLKTKDILRLGVHPRTLYAMRDTGILEQISRGLYRLAELAPLGNPDLVSVAMRSSNGVICLFSALAYHEITTQVPHEVYLAVERGKRPPVMVHPPVRVFWFRGKAFTEGIETHTIDSVPVRIYSPEKTLADCFKCRNRIGLDTAIEALKLYRQRKELKIDILLRCARVCRVEKVMRPYLESIL